MPSGRAKLFKAFHPNLERCLVGRRAQGLGTRHSTHAIRRAIQPSAAKRNNTAFSIDALFGIPRATLSRNGTKKAALEIKRGQKRKLVWLKAIYGVLPLTILCDSPLECE